MRNYISFIILLWILSVVPGCQNEKKNAMEQAPAGTTQGEAASNDIQQEIKPDTPQKDSTQELLDKLRKKPIGGDFKMVGELKYDVLTFKSLAFGDLLHLNFVDSKGKEYDFGNNATDIQLESTDDTGSEDNGGYAANKKYLNKKFFTVWRRLKLNRAPRDEMEMYNEEFDEIIYLKQVQ